MSIPPRLQLEVEPAERANVERAVAELENEIEVLNSFVLAAQGEQKKLEARLQSLRATLA